MKKIEVTINGKAYPCRQTMGAMLRFKQETGKEVTDIEPGSLADLCTFLWCCIVSACKSDGVEFNLSLLEFADSLTSDEMQGWSESVGEKAEDTGEGEKKRK